MADEKISQLADAGAPQNTDQLVIARSGSTLSLLFSNLKAAIPGGVTSVFGRTAAVTAQTGDYTAAQVTNAADLSSSSQQAFTGEVKAPDFAAAGLTGATAASRYVGATASGAPASGAFLVGDFVIARNGHLLICTTAGSPGTWTDAGSVGNLVSSVFGRTGAVAAQTGDYTASQVGALASSSDLSAIASANATAADWSNNSHKITSVKDPTLAQDAATKNYVDSVTPGNTGGKGHLTTATAANAPADLAPGSDGSVLTADSTQTVGLKYALPGLTLIGTDSASVAKTTLTIGSIPSTYTSLLVVFSVRSSTSALNEFMAVNFNADTTAANYATQFTFSHGATISGLLTTTTSGLGVQVLAATGPHAYFSAVQMVIPRYNLTTSDVDKMVLIDAIDATTGAALQVFNGGGTWAGSSAAITSITAKLASGANFVAQSYMSVYGMA